MLNVAVNHAAEKKEAFLIARAQSMCAKMAVSAHQKRHVTGTRSKQMKNVIDFELYKHQKSNPLNPGAAQAKPIDVMKSILGLITNKKKVTH